MIITSLLDTDLYKFTMMQVVLHQFPGAQVSYKFKCRNPGVNLAQFATEIRAEIKSLCGLQFTEGELAYLRSMNSPTRKSIAAASRAKVDLKSRDLFGATRQRFPVAAPKRNIAAPDCEPVRGCYPAFTALIVFTTSRNTFSTSVIANPAARTLLTVSRFIEGPIFSLRIVMKSIIWRNG